MSLRRRVLLGVVAVAVVLLAADVALASTFRGYLIAQVDGQLTEAAPRALFGRGRGRPVFTEYFVAYAGTDGRIVADNADALGGGAPAPDPAQVVRRAARRGEPLEPFTLGPAGAGGWRLVALDLAVPGGARYGIVGAPLDRVAATVDRMVAVLALATGAVLAASALAAWWVLRQGVRPLAAMTATAGAIARGDLSERVADTDDRTEAGRLGAALNVMLARIEEAFAERAESEARLRRFVADASHELRTPLTSIRGYAELHRQGALPDAAAVTGAMRRVEAEATRMGGLVDDLLLLARLDQGRPLERRPLRLDRLVDDSVRDARVVEPDRPITADIQPVTVAGDEARLRQAVANLLANARVHTPPGTTVTVTVRDRGAAAEVEVADRGPGLDAAVAARVFERFYRADTARTRASGGTGLGLAIVAGIVAAHGGEVAVDTAPGQGARFRLHLPTAPGAPS
jgi:two-component system OmpR family sensor kinase